MSSTRETRSQVRQGNDGGMGGLNRDGGSGVFKDEMEKWRKVAEMIGESLESVCNMGQQEREELLLLLPGDDGDAIEDVDEKDALLGELLESEDEESENLKRPRSSPPNIEETKKSKLSNEEDDKPPKRYGLLSRSKKKGGASNKVSNVSDPPDPVTVEQLDFSKYVSPTATGSKLKLQSPSPQTRNEHKNDFSMGSESPKVTGIARMAQPEEGVLSPVFKGRIKRQSRKSQESYHKDSSEIREQSQNDSGKNAHLKVDSTEKKFQESDYVVEHDEDIEISTIVNDKQIEKNGENDKTNVKADNINSKEKESECDTTKCAMPEELVRENETTIRDAVIDKIVGWNDIYKFNNINLINENVSSLEKCFGTLEEEQEKYKFGNAIKSSNIDKEVAQGIQDIQKYFKAIKKIKGESVAQNELPLVTVCPGRREDGFGLMTSQIKPKTSWLTRGKNKSGSSGLAKAENYLNNRRRTRSRDQDVLSENENIEVDDSSDDFETKRDDNDTEWCPESQKPKRGRPCKSADAKSKHPSEGETRKPRVGSKRKLLSRKEHHQRYDDAPLEDLPESKETKGKGQRGRGRGTGRGKGLARGEKNNNMGRGKGKNNNPANVASTSTKSFGGESFYDKEGESSEGDEVTIVDEIPSPASTSFSHGRKGKSDGLSNHAQVLDQPPILPDSSLHGNIAKVASGDSLSDIHVKEVSDIHVKEEAKGKCPMCEREFWMNELEKHAAGCDGGDK